MSVWVQAIIAAKMEENPPITATTSNAFGATIAKTGNNQGLYFVITDPDVVSTNAKFNKTIRSI